MSHGGCVGVSPDAVCLLCFLMRQAAKAPHAAAVRPSTPLFSPAHVHKPLQPNRAFLGYHDPAERPVECKL
jgi:hypothetical protein